jgi:hypothetical protein
LSALQQFVNSLRYNAQVREAIDLLIYSVVGGVLGLLIRLLYRRFGLAVANRDGFGSIFPLLTVATVLVIFVVKSSLALSLGLVGALSIVRFRAAIKEPEELIFLFFCIAVGLALGAQYPELALAGTAVFALFVILRHRFSKGSGDALLLTISGPTQAMCSGDAEKLGQTLRESAGRYSLQRLIVEDGHVQLHAIVPNTNGTVPRMLGDLRTRLPGCRISCVSLSSLL